jgi:hypothetical protein
MRSANGGELSFEIDAMIAALKKRLSATSQV